MIIYQDKEFKCSFELAVDMFSGRWKALVLYILAQNGTMRYSELKRASHGITQKMLTQTLRDLEKYQLVHREVYPVIPPKVEYSLTEYGERIMPILEMIQDFGDYMIERYDEDGIIKIYLTTEP